MKTVTMNGKVVGYELEIGEQIHNLIPTSGIKTKEEIIADPGKDISNIEALTELFLKHKIKNISTGFPADIFPIIEYTTEYTTEVKQPKYKPTKETQEIEITQDMFLSEYEYQKKQKENKIQPKQENKRLITFDENP